MNITAQELMKIFGVDAGAAEAAMAIIDEPSWGNDIYDDFEDLNDLLSTDGAQWIFAREGDSDTDSPGLYYLNMGDTYATTLLGEVPEQGNDVQYSLGDWGSWEEDAGAQRSIDKVRSHIVYEYPQYDDLDDDMWRNITAAYEDHQDLNTIMYYIYTQELLDDFYKAGEISRVTDLDLSDKDEQEIIFEITNYLADDPQAREDFVAEIFSGGDLDDIQGIELTELMADAGIDVEAVMNQRASDSQPFLSKDLEPRGKYTMRGQYR